MLLSIFLRFTKANKNEVANINILRFYKTARLLARFG